MKTDNVKIFDDRKIRTIWDSENEKWFISIVDVISILTESIDPAAYWRKLKKRLLEEGNQTVTNCNGLKMLAPDGKMRKTNETMLTRNTRYFKILKEALLNVVHVISNGERNFQIDANTKDSHVASLLKIIFSRPLKQFQVICLIRG